MADTVMPNPAETSVRAFRRDRDRKAVRTGTVGIAAQILGHGIRLIVIPLSIALLGVEQYGLWMAVGSVIAWGGVTDLGLAPGLINVVAAARARGDHEEMRRAISTAFAAYGAITVLIAALVIAISMWEGLPSFIGARTPELAASTRSLILVCGMVFAASTVTRVVSTTTEALQEGYWVSVTYIAGSVTSLLLLLWMARGGSCGLVEYALVASLPALAAQVILAAYVFGWRHRELAPGPRWVRRQSLRTLWGFAGPLTIYQGANMMALYSANLLVANRLGPAAVPHYSVPYAAFAALITATSNIVAPYIPAIAEAHTRKDLNWLGKKAKGMLAAGAVIALSGGILLTFAGPWLLSHWTSGSIRPGTGLLACFAFFAAARSAGVAVSSVSHGLGLVRFSAWTSIAASSFYVISAWFALTRLGVEAIPLTATVASFAYVVVNIPRIKSELRTSR